MRTGIYIFLGLPIAARCTFFLLVVLVLYQIFGRLALKMLSLIPWALNKLSYVLYCLLQIPVSILHSSMGGVFGGIDNGLARCAEWCCSFTENVRGRMSKPKTMFNRRAFVIFLALVAYLFIPAYLNHTEKLFTFWQAPFHAIEAKIINLMLR